MMSTEEKLSLLKAADVNKFTEPTIKSLSAQIRGELIATERYEQIEELEEITKKQLKRFDDDRVRMVTKIMSDSEIKKAFSL